MIISIKPVPEASKACHTVGASAEVICGSCPCSTTTQDEGENDQSIGSSGKAGGPSGARNYRQKP